MKKTGEMVLPLHYGHAPSWLVKRMKALADEVVLLIVEDSGPQEFLRKVSDPLWFQAFGCVLGFDWHSSGLTTVVTGVLKDVLTMPKHQVEVMGGKGRASKNTQTEILELGESLNFSSSAIDRLQYASRIAAKVDNAAIQAGYPIYHHTFFLSEKRDWCVVQQGMNIQDGTARRYHWLSEDVRDFVVEPHKAIVGELVRPRVLNMTAREAEENRKTCVDLVGGDTNNLISSIRRIGSTSLPLDLWTGEKRQVRLYQSFEMPKRLNWDLFRELYDTQPKNYEELLAFRGVGPSVVRSLALVSQLVYGKPASWRDPVKFSFAHGGKDGVPFPVNRRVMDRSIHKLQEILSASGIQREEKLGALKRLERFSSNWGI